MEEENEQLDYDEDVLETAQKKAKELRQEVAEELVVSQQSSIQPSNLPTPTDQLSPTKANPIETITTNSTAPRLNFRYHVNPNFNKPRHLHHSNISNLPFSYGQVQNNRFRYPAPILPVAPGHFIRPNQQHSFAHQPRHLHGNQMVTAYPAPHQIPPQTSHHQILGHQTLPASVPTASGGGNVYINRNALGSNNNNWDMMVDEFVRKNSSARRRRHYSRSRSSSSRSQSTKSSTSRSHSASRSSSSGSKSPNRDSDNRRKYSTKRGAISTKGQNGSRGRHGQQGKSNNPQVKITHQTIECARAIGLDDEYLKKVEEQNRLREEIARRKNQHRRKETTASGKSEGEIQVAVPSKRPKIQGPINGGVADGKQRNGGKEEKASSANNKLRPYLAVMVTNLRGVPEAEKKVGQLAATIGPVKKIWRDGADDCNVIFERHEHAKQFMLQFHGKRGVLPQQSENTTASSIDVTLKKVFLNLTNGGSSANEE